jgi:hypothetical protein
MRELLGRGPVARPPPVSRDGRKGPSLLAFIATAMAALGHEDAFPPPRLSVRCGFSQATLAGTHGNGRDAPIPAGRETEIERQGSTHSEHSPAHEIKTLAMPGLSLCDSLSVCRLARQGKELADRRQHGAAFNKGLRM